MTMAFDLRQKATALQRQALDLLEKAEHLERRPQDKFGDGAVLIFTREGRYGTGSWKDYQGPLKYAAIKAGDRPECWFLTGLTQYAKTWDQLLEFIGQENFHTVHTAGWAHLTQQHGAPGFERFRV